MNIIGIAGKAEAGKDTTADFLVERFGFVKVALADPIKRVCCDIFDFSYEQLWGDKKNEGDVRYRRPDGSLLTPRFALQTLGTEWGRNCYPNVWIDEAICVAKELLDDETTDYVSEFGVVNSDMSNPKCRGVVISDVRFQNEADAIRAAGGKIWWVERPSLHDEEWRLHASEQSFERRNADQVIWNNASLSALGDAVEAIMKVM